MITPETKVPVAARRNRLAAEKSPYLLQHADNPVDWYPWGEEAFAKARTENKPIFLSIGYSTCHWCHVMAHESFENAETAAVMNREFVNIKVDREERPDVDRVYMTFVQATTGGGGWPMSVWLTPDLQPFVGGTYFPPVDRYNQPAFTTVLLKIAQAWKENREKISAQGAKVIEALREAQDAAAQERGEINPAWLDEAYDQFARTFDAHEGGFGRAPKFPRPVSFNFLTRYYARDPKSASGQRALEMNLFTLRKMAAGGMHDQLGGGFHRYSVDSVWHVPHFEKMLYDQAQLAAAYLDAFQITHEAEFAAVARDTLDYVMRDMTSPDGGFFSAEDADSAIPDPVAAVYDRRSVGKDGGHRQPLQKKAEGAFYVWSKEEIDELLGADAEIFASHYGVEGGGNVAPASDPHGELSGKNILFQRRSVAETTKHFGPTEAVIEKSLERSRGKLMKARGKRPRPHLDDKIIAGWNGLMISAFARAAQVLGEPIYLKAAQGAAQFVRENLWDGSRSLLFRSYREGRGEVEAFADDYSFVIQAMLDLYAADFDVEWLKLAWQLQEVQDRLFWDGEIGGYFSTSGNDRSVVLRMKDDNDSAEPSASSVAANNLLRWAQLRSEPELRDRAVKTITAFAPTLSRFASAMPQLLVALEASRHTPRQVVIAGKRDSADTRALLREFHQHFLPDATLLLADGGVGQAYLGEKSGAIREMKPIKGKAAAYVCENFTCQTPVTTVGELRRLLGLTA